MGKVTSTAKVVGKGARLAVKYGPQAKIAWDKGGKQAGTAAARRARTLNSRRKAFKHAATVVEGSVLKVAPTGSTMYVVFAGDVPIATYPKSELTPVELLAHADLTKRIPANQA
jgi:hypothetical protein